MAEGRFPLDDIVFDDDLRFPSLTGNKPWIYADAIDSKYRSSDRNKQSSNDVNSIPSDPPLEEMSNKDPGGHWLLFRDKYANTELTDHGNFWPIIEKLVVEHKSRDTGISHARCSTRWFQKEYDYGVESENGLIQCYVRDYTDKALVKKAADSIRSVLDYKHDMYFKTVEDTKARKFIHSGSKKVSIYKHNQEHQLFERDEKHNFNWVLVNV